MDTCVADMSGFTPIVSVDSARDAVQMLNNIASLTNEDIDKKAINWMLNGRNFSTTEILIIINPSEDKSYECPYNSKIEFPDYDLLLMFFTSQVGITKNYNELVFTKTSATTGTIISNNILKKIETIWLDDKLF
jgi:hypothetical protein